MLGWGGNREVEMREGDEVEIAGLKEAQIQSPHFLVVIYADK